MVSGITPQEASERLGVFQVICLSSISYESQVRTMYVICITGRQLHVTHSCMLWVLYKPNDSLSTLYFVLGLFVTLSFSNGVFLLLLNPEEGVKRV